MNNLLNILPSRSAWFLLPAIVFFIVELITGMKYPVFRDEFYYLDCANHLSWGYVDHPSLSIFILFVWKSIFGSSLISIRLLPAVTGAILILLTGKLTESLGGSRSAQMLSAIAAASVPSYIAIANFYSMNVFDLLFWAMLFLILIKLINTQDQKLWLWFGLIAGLGLMNKISIAYFGAALFTAMLFTKERAWLKNKYFWLGGAISVTLFLPYIIWNIANDYATLEFIRNASNYKIAGIGPLDFFKEQVLQTNPLNFILWFPGLIALIVYKPLRKYRLFGFIYIFVYIILTVQKSKPYYLAQMYTILISAGAIAVTSFVEKRKIGFLRYTLGTLIVVFAMLISPIIIPVLEPDGLVKYMDKIGLTVNTGENSKQGKLPQLLADRMGWSELTDKTASVYRSLDEIERKHTSIFAKNYGEAGAINYYGKPLGLPEVISGHNSHWLWGPMTDTIVVLIVVGSKKESFEDSFNSVEQIDVFNNQYSMPYEMNLPILVCRKPKAPIRELWLRSKMYI